ncbi:MAG: DUF362 domain-containing protein [Calditrichaceae bacterium]|nr:DUF362 domain-containing protein [Calditrichaceae bacterium]
MDRRAFIKKTALAAGSGILYPRISLCKPFQSNVKSRVVCVTNLSEPNITDHVLTMLDKGMCSLFDCANPVEAWQKVVNPGEVIGLKVNCLSGYGSTHPILIEAIIERLNEAGIRKHNIIIWDRLSTDLEDGGFKIQDQKNNVRYIGNEVLGFHRDLQVFGSVASLVCNTIVRECDCIINLPLLKDHSIAGLTMSLKNMFGAIHNPNKYHLNTGDPYIADVNMLPSIRKKIRLHICDAIEAQYEGGPSFMPHWRWPMNSLLFSADPVALDYYGWQIIDAKRIEMGLKSLTDVGREPTYIATATDNQHRLGTNDPNKIELVKLI